MAAVMVYWVVSVCDCIYRRVFSLPAWHCLPLILSKSRNVKFYARNGCLESCHEL